MSHLVKQGEKHDFRSKYPIFRTVWGGHLPTFKEFLIFAALEGVSGQGGKESFSVTV